MNIKFIIDYLKNKIKKDKKPVQKVVIDLETLSKITNLSRDIYDQENYEKKRREEMDRFATQLSLKIAEGINIVLKHNFEPIVNKINDIETKIDTIENIKQKVYSSDEKIQQILKDVDYIKQKIKAYETSQEKNLANAIIQLNEQESVDESSSNDDKEAEIPEDIINVDKEIVQEIEEKGIDIKPVNKPKEVKVLDLNKYVIINTYSFIYFLSLIKDRMSSLGKDEIRSYIGVSLLKESGLLKHYEDNKKPILDTYEYFFVSRSYEVKLNKDLLYISYYYQINSVFSMISYLRYLLDREIREEKDNINRDELQRKIILMDFIWFLAEKLIITSEAYKYPSAEYKENAYPLLEERYRLYSNIPLGIHSFNVLVLAFQYVVLQEKASSKYSLLDILKIIAGALSHDIGKIYVDNISEHKKNQEVFNKLIEEYFSYLSSSIQSTGNPKLPGYKRIELSFIDSTQRFLREYISLNYDKEKFLSYVKDDEAFNFIKSVLIFHHVSANKLDFKEKDLELFKIVFYADKYARILENRYYLYINSIYEASDFAGNSENIEKKLVDYTTDLPKIFRGYKFDIYSYDVNNIKNLMYSFKNLSDKGKDEFLKDFSRILECIVEAVSSGSYYSKENRLSYIETRSAYKVPFYYLKNELLSYGWGSLLGAYQSDIKGEDYVLFDFSEFNQFLKKQISNFNIADLEIVEEKTGEKMLYISNNLIREIINGYRK